MRNRIKWWQFWHRHVCLTRSDGTGVWGECVVCGERFGFVSRWELEEYFEGRVYRNGCPILGDE